MRPDKETERQKVLIVDDSETNVQVLSEILQPLYRTFFALNGKEAIDLAYSLIPDIILLDIMMPGMDGYQVCRRLKTEDDLKDIPVIFVTAMDAEDDETKGLELGAIDYISKPINPAIVKARVRNHLEMKRYRDLLEKMSLIDGLTGIPNRREFDKYLELEWKRAVRSGEPISLVLMDIDYFKQFNDHYGHLSGDDCLKRVAKALSESLQRPADMVARYGGEEFVSILPETDGKGALFMAERFRESVKALVIPHEYSTAAGHVTISCGAATIFPQNGRSSNDIIKLADDLLYEAKNAGRDRVVEKTA